MVDPVYSGCKISESTQPPGADYSTPSDCETAGGEPVYTTPEERKAPKKTPFKGPEVLRNYNGNYSETFRMLYTLLASLPPGTEIMIGSYKVTVQDQKLYINGEEAAEADLTTLVAEMDKVFSGITRPQILKLIKDLVALKDKSSINGKSLDLVKLAEEVITNNKPLKDALDIDGVVTDSAAKAAEDKAADDTLKLNDLCSKYENASAVGEKINLASRIETLLQTLGEEEKKIRDEEKRTAAKQAIKKAQQKLHEEKVRLAKGAIQTAANILALSKAVPTDKAVLADPEVQAALKQKFVELLKNDPSANPVIIASLLGLLTYTDGEEKPRIITFEHDEQTYTVIVEPGTEEGAYTIKSDPPAEQPNWDNFKITQKDEKWTVTVSSEDEDPVAIDAAEVIAQDPAQPQIITGDSNRKTMYIPTTGLRIEWTDANNDNNIDADEKESAQAGFDQNKDGTFDENEKMTAGGLSDQLFAYFANGTTQLKPGDDSEIELAEIEERAQTIAEFAEILGITENEALGKYNTEKLGRVSFADLRKAKGEAVDTFTSLKGLDERTARTRLEEAGYSDEIIDSILKDWNTKKDNETFAQKQAEELLRRAVEALKAAGKITYDAIIAYWEGEEAEVAVEARGASAPVDKKAERQEIAKDKQLRTIYYDYRDNPAQQKGFALDYLKKLIHEGNINEAEEFYRKVSNPESAYYINGFEQDPEVLNALIEALTARESLRNYKAALHYIKKLSNEKERYLQLGLLAARCLKSRNQAVRRLAPIILRDIKKDHEFTNTDRATPAGQKEGEMVTFYQGLGIKVTKTSDGMVSVKVEDLITAAQEAANEDPEIWFIQHDLLEIKFEGERRDERARQQQPDGAEISLRSDSKEKRQEAIAAIQRLDEIIKDKNTDAYTRARAHYVRGLLLYALSKGLAPDQKVKIGSQDLTISELQDEAMFELRAAWEEAGKIENNPLQVQKLRREIWGRMVDIVDFVRHSGSGEKEAEKKKRATELAEFIPDYTDPNMVYGACKFKNGSYYYSNKDPHGAREAYRAESDRYQSYQSKLSDRPADAADADKKEPTPVEYGKRAIYWANKAKGEKDKKTAEKHLAKAKHNLKKAEGAKNEGKAKTAVADAQKAVDALSATAAAAPPPKEEEKKTEEPKASPAAGGEDPKKDEKPSPPPANTGGDAGSTVLKKPPKVK